VIGIFSRSEEELKKHKEKLDLTDLILADIVRRDREGWGILRRDLSIFPSILNQPSAASPPIAPSKPSP
jgi:hypothetical protein